MASHSRRYTCVIIPRLDQSVPYSGRVGTAFNLIQNATDTDRRTWLKVKCLNREEFVVVGWSDPEGSRHRIGSLLLGYYTPEGMLVYAGRAGTGMPEAELERLWQRLQPLVVDKMPLAERRHEVPGSDHPWCLAGSIGCGLKWWSR